MPTVVLKLTRAPSDASTEQTPQAAAPLLRGTGDTDYLCGNCARHGRGTRVGSSRSTVQHDRSATDRQDALADALFATSRIWPMELHFQKALAGAPPEAIAATLGRRASG